MAFSEDLTRKILGYTGPINTKVNPYVIKVCDTCDKHDVVRYKGAKKPTGPYECRKCVCNRPSTKILKSTIAKKQWENPDFRQLVESNSRNIWKDEARRAKMSVVRTDPEIKRKMIAANKEKWADLDHQKKMLAIYAAYPKVSKPQLILYDILDDLGVKFFREYNDREDDPECRIGPYSVDCVIPRENARLIIEVQGEYWHTRPKTISKDKAKAIYLNQIPGVEVKYLWDHEFLQKDRVLKTLSYWLDKQIDQIEFKFCDVEIRDAPASKYNNLLCKYHYLVNAGASGIARGAYLNDQLIAVCIFSPVGRQTTAATLNKQEKNIRELSRLCIHPSYQKKNFGSWFISKCIRSLPKEYETIISYADTTFNHYGVVYQASNFVLDKEVPPDYWYVNADGWVMHKKTLYNRAKQMHSTERQYAELHQYTKVWGGKKLRYRFDR